MLGKVAYEDRMTTLLTTAVVLLALVPASAQDYSSANYILPGCQALLARSETVPWLQGRCIGLVDAIQYLSNGTSDGTQCTHVPRGATGEQAIRVVVNYIGARPQRWNESFTSLALEG
jgi:hypothetical protein